MQAALVALIVVAAVISRPVEARLWRAGKLSDRTTALLLLSRFPVLVLLFALLDGASPAFTVAVTALVTLPVLAFYRVVLGLLRVEKAGQVS